MNWTIHRRLVTSHPSTWPGCSGGAGDAVDDAVGDAEDYWLPWKPRASRWPIAWPPSIDH